MSFLDIDRSSLENSLLLNKDENIDTMNSLLHDLNNVPNIPTKLVVPTPGLCIKTFTRSGDKVFINVCHTEDIPPPKGNTIPMSIGNEKEVKDKSGEPCMAFDVAVNSTFFCNNQNEIVMLTILEGIANKHGLDLEENKHHILRNIKSKGKISPMNIEQRSVKPDPLKKPLISEIQPKKETLVASRDNKSPIVPDYNLIKVNGAKKFYASEVDLKDITSKNDITLQVGEDRVFVSTNGNVKYELEYHFPEIVNNDLCKAEFNAIEQVLTIIAPLKK